MFLTSEILKLHSGKVGVISELGKGSEFWFTIPIGDHVNCIANRSL